MKKTLIAVAALVATGAFAQSTVAITGTFDPSLAISKVTGGTDVNANQTFIRNNSRGTTNFTFRVSNDLGGGMAAVGLYEADYNIGSASNNAGGAYAGNATANTALNTLGAGGGEVYAGLTSKMGNIKLGAANTPSLGVQAGRQPYGTKIGGGFGTTMGTSHVRESNSVVLESANYSGFTAALGHSFSVNADALPALAAAGSKTDIGLRYAAGPLRAGASFFSGQGVGQQNFMAQYDIGAATIYAGMHRAKAAGVDSNTGSNLALKYNLSGTTAVMANIGKIDDKTAANLDSGILGLGLDYALSKQTTAYVRHENRRVDNTTLATQVKKSVTTAFGLQLNF